MQRDKSSPCDGHWHRGLVARSGCAAHLEAERRLHVLELSNRSLRQESANLSKQVACWRREAKRARADVQLAEQGTVKPGKKGYFFLMRGDIVIALRRNIEGGIGAAAFTDLLLIDACKQSTMALGSSDWGLLGSATCLSNLWKMRTTMARIL